MVPDVLAGPGGEEGLIPVACAVSGNPVETHAEVLTGLAIPLESYGELLEAARTRYVELADRYSVD